MELTDLIAKANTAEVLETENKAASELLEQNAKLVTEKDNFIAGLQASVTAKEEELKASLEQAEAIKAELETYKASKAELEAKVSELQANAKTVEETSLEMVASQGLASPIKVEVKAEEALTKEEAFNKYNDLLATDSRKAGEFYQANKGLFTK